MAQLLSIHDEKLDTDDATENVRNVSEDQDKKRLFEIVHNSFRNQDFEEEG